MVWKLRRDPNWPADLPRIPKPTSLPKIPEKIPEEDLILMFPDEPLASPDADLLAAEGCEPDRCPLRPVFRSRQMVGKGQADRHAGTGLDRGFLS